MHFKRSLPDIIQTKNSKNAAGIIKIDNACYSCSGQNPVVLKAFKVACLGYFPTNVKYQNDVYSRFTLLLHKTNVLNSAWETFQNLGPFGFVEEPLWENEHVVNVGDTTDTRHDQPTAICSSFDIQPRMDLSFQGTPPSKLQTFVDEETKQRIQQDRTSLIRQIFDSEVLPSSLTSKGNFASDL